MKKNICSFCAEGYRTEYESPLGKIVLAADGKALLGLWFEGQKYFLGALKKERLIFGENEIFVRTKEWLDRYFAGDGPGVTVQDGLGVTVHDGSGMMMESGSLISGEEDQMSLPLAALDVGVPLRPIGTPFQQQVWRLLCQIPYGEVTTYGALAKKMAKLMGRASMSAQAVGGAVGHNPISLIIPCHRVVGRNGDLTGYAGGMEKKQYLLKQEGAI